MRSIALFSQKGGSGKTTVAVHLAVAAQEGGLRVVVLDTDPQGSAGVWGAARAKGGQLFAEPKVVSVDAGDIAGALAACSSDGYDLVVVDTPPHAQLDASRIASAVGLVLIPVRPTAFDLAAVPAVVALVQAARTRSAFVLSAVPARAPEAVDARSALETYGLPVAPGQIGDRRPYSRAVATGRAVTEFPRSSTAATEIRQLWSWLRKGVLP